MEKDGSTLGDSREFRVTISQGIKWFWNGLIFKGKPIIFFTSDQTRNPFNIFTIEQILYLFSFLEHTDLRTIAQGKYYSIHTNISLSIISGSCR